MKRWILRAPLLNAPMALVYTAAAGTRARVMAFTVKTDSNITRSVVARVDLWRPKDVAWPMAHFHSIEVQAAYADEAGDFAGNVQVAAFEDVQNRIITSTYLAGMRNAAVTEHFDQLGLSPIDLMMSDADWAWRSPEIMCDVVVFGGTQFDKVALGVTLDGGLTHSVRMLVAEEKQGGVV